MSQRSLNIPCYNKEVSIPIHRNDNAFRQAILEYKNKEELMSVTVSSTDLWLSETNNRELAKTLFRSVNTVFDVSYFKTSNPVIFKDDFFDSYVDMCFLEANMFQFEEFIKNPNLFESSHPCGIIAPTMALIPLVKEFGSSSRMFDALFKGYEIQKIKLWGPIPPYQMPDGFNGKFEHYASWNEMHSAFNMHTFRDSLGIEDKKDVDDSYDEDCYGLGSGCYSNSYSKQSKIDFSSKKEEKIEKKVLLLEDNLIEK